MSHTTELYRPNAAIIYQRSDGTVLVCERVKPAGAWQFPQGGIKKGEAPMEAACREGMEETFSQAEAGSAPQWSQLIRNLKVGQFLCRQPSGQAFVVSVPKR